MSRTAAQILDREFLEIRAKLIDLAASLDRIGRSEGSLAGDPRVGNIAKALEILAADAANRVEQIQMLFALPYDEHWQK